MFSIIANGSDLVHFNTNFIEFFADESRVGIDNLAD